MGTDPTLRHKLAHLLNAERQKLAEASHGMHEAEDETDRMSWQIIIWERQRIVRELAALLLEEHK